MKKIFFGVVVLFAAGTFVACSNDATTGENTDTVSTNTTMTTESTGDYAAKADEFERNSAAGKYRSVSNGEPVNLTVDRNSGRVVNAATNEPVRRYIVVDGTTWWLYDIDGNRIGEARQQNGKVEYQENGNWVDYETKYKAEDDEWKMKSDDTKIKMDEDGMKIKTDDKKIKTDEDGTKVKEN